MSEPPINHLSYSLNDQIVIFQSYTQIFGLHVNTVMVTLNLTSIFSTTNEPSFLLHSLIDNDK